jgi:hypothetical protein
MAWKKQWMPKSPTKVARIRAEENYDRRMKRQKDRSLLGSKGAAGPLRHIDPKDYKPS